MALRAKDKCPFKPDQFVVCKRAFAWAGGDTITLGQKFRAGDRVVQENWTAFADAASTVPSEYENPWESMPPPPEHAPAVHVSGTQIPLHRQVESMVDVAAPVPWSPGRPGNASNQPPPFARSLLRRGQILDICSATVAEHPSWFRFVARDVTSEDVERFRKSEGVS